MRLDAGLTEQIRNSTNIVDLIGQYVRLKKAGSNYQGLCPFHSEKDPSFSVSESKQLFYCFGCNVGGDVIKFIQLIENVAYPEAMRMLAERAGISLPRSQEDARSFEKKERLQKAMEEARRFFRQTLAENGAAQEYLSGRQIKSSTIERFQLGYAQGGNRLMRRLYSAGFTEQELLDCGLIVRNDSGEHYDRFRNRIIFPICDLSGRTIAFGGRIIGDGQPKYLNSPETALYHKGSHLFGLNWSRNEIREKDFAILVEGYFDCMIPFQSGVRNIVASLGTALTENQVRLLGRYTRKVIVCFDPDSAGTRASIRSIDLFLTHGFQVNILSLPEGEDPDSFILNAGLSAYLEQLQKSRPYMDFLLELFLSQEKDPKSSRAKTSVASKILPFLAKVPNRIQRSEYISRIASRLRISQDALAFELRKYRRPATGRTPQLSLQPGIESASLAERSLLAAILNDPHPEKWVPHLDLKLFEGLITEKVFREIVELWCQNSEISVIDLRDRLEDQDRNLLDRIAMGEEDSAFLEKDIESCFSALRDNYLERLSRRIQEEIEKEERQGITSPRLVELLREKERIGRERQAFNPSSRK